MNINSISQNDYYSPMNYGYSYNPYNSYEKYTENYTQFNGYSNQFSPQFQSQFDQPSSGETLYFDPAKGQYVKTKN